jgi:hypothetical protein
VNVDDWLDGAPAAPPSDDAADGAALAQLEASGFRFLSKREEREERKVLERRVIARGPKGMLVLFVVVSLPDGSDRASRVVVVQTGVPRRWSKAPLTSWIRSFDFAPLHRGLAAAIALLEEQQAAQRKVPR